MMKMKPSESESKILEVRKKKMEKQINLWLRKRSTGTWEVNGFVHDIETQGVISGATVTLDDVSTQTNERGFFQFSGIPSGRHVISVQKEGYEPTADMNKPSRVEFVL